MAMPLIGPAPLFVDHTFTDRLTSIANEVKFYPGPVQTAESLLSFPRPAIPSIASFGIPDSRSIFRFSSIAGCLRTAAKKLAIPFLCILIGIQTITSNMGNPLINTPLLPLLLLIPFMILVSSTLLLLSMLASTTPDLPYFFLRLDLRNLTPTQPDTVPALGLPDFYQIGLFSFCSGTFPSPYPSRDSPQIETCSAPMYPFWPDPLHIIRDQLLAGAVVVLPAEAQSVLTILREVSITNTNLYIASLVFFFAAFLAALPVTGWGLFFHWRRRGELRVHTSWKRAYRWSKVLFPPGMLLAFVGSAVAMGAAGLSTGVFWGGSEGLRKAAELVDVQVWGDVGEALGLAWGAVGASWIVNLLWVWVCWRVWRAEARLRRVGESAEHSGEGSRVGSIKAGGYIVGEGGTVKTAASIVEPVEKESPLE